MLLFWDLPVSSAGGRPTRKVTPFGFQVMRPKSSSSGGLGEFLIAREASVGQSKDPWWRGLLGNVVWAFKFFIYLKCLFIFERERERMQVGEGQSGGGDRGAQVGSSWTLGSLMRGSNCKMMT